MFKLSELAEIAGGRVKGNPDLQITGFCSLDNPSPGCVAYLERGKDAAKIQELMLGALVTTDALAGFFGDVIISDNPKLAFVEIMEKFIAAGSPGGFVPGVHETAVVAPNTIVADSAAVRPNAVIGQRCKIGARTYIGAGTYIGDDVTIGDDCFIHANVSIYSRSVLGNRVEIQSSTVIGAMGFGYVPTKDGHRRFPQVGRVVIEDDVEIGANCCIDRDALDETVVHSGTKLDNLVQVAHGVRIGSNTVIAAQTGISGGTRIGNWCVIGGQAGFQGHITVGDQSIVAAQSGVFSDLPFKSKVSGYPAKPHAQSLKVLALTFKLPEMLDKLKSQEIELEMMRGELQGLSRRIRELEGGGTAPGAPSGGGNKNGPTGEA